MCSKQAIFLLGVTCTSMLCTGARADILFFFLDEGDQHAWEQALAAERQEVQGSFNPTSIWDDPGIIGLDGPQSHNTTGGAIPENLAVDSNLNYFGAGGPNGRGAGGTGLAIVGASAGFGNSETAVLANFFVDSFDIMAGPEYPTAMEFAAVSLLGSNRVAISVFDRDENPIAQTLGFPAPPMGNRIGILATGGDVIGRINITDTDDGAEGIVGTFIAYAERPLPATLLGFRVDKGILLGGDIDDLKHTDDAFVHVLSGFGRRFSESHLVDLIVEATTEDISPERLNIVIESHIDDPVGFAKVSLRNWQSDDFERVGQFPIGLNDEIFTIENIDASNYVRISGAIELSIKHVVFVPFFAFRFESFLDWVDISVE